MAVPFKKKDNKVSLTEKVMKLKRALKVQFKAKESELRNTFGKGIYENILCVEFEKQITIEALKTAFVNHNVEGKAKPHLVLNIKSYRNQLLEFDIFFDFADNAMHIANDTEEFVAILDKEITEGMSVAEQASARDRGMLNFILTREETKYTFFYIPGDKVMEREENNNENGGVN